MDRAPAPTHKLTLAGEASLALSLHSSTRNIGIRPYCPELQRWPAAAWAHFSPKKVPDVFSNITDVFNVTDKNSKFSKLKVGADLEICGL